MPGTRKGEQLSNERDTSITFIFTAEPNQVAEGERLFASHAEWMEKTHHREGELALVGYDVTQGSELSNDLDPSSTPTDRTCFVLNEVYSKPAGLADHWKRADSWQDFGAFMAWAGEVDVTVLHGSPITHSLW